MRRCPRPGARFTAPSPREGLAPRDPDPRQRNQMIALRPRDGRLEGAIYRFQVGAGDRRVRLDVYLDLVFRGRSRTYWQRKVADGAVLVGDRRVRSSRRIGQGDVVSIDIELLGTMQTRDEAPCYEILHQDAHVVAVSKRAGAFSHPAGRLHRRSVITLLREEIGDDPGEIKPCHRLDRFVSGLILHARGGAAARFLAGQFEDDVIEKEYLALVEGEVEGDERLIDLPVGRDPDSVIRIKMGIDPGGKSSVTGVRVLERFPGYTLVALAPRTGRRHQLRLHLATIGHPIVNDPLYGTRIDVAYYERQQYDNHDDAADANRWIALHSHRLRFLHPGTRSPMLLEAPLCGAFAGLVEALRTWKPYP